MEAAGLEAFDNIAGGETAGIPLRGLSWPNAMGRPCPTIRKQPKGYGRTAQIEGEMREGDRVLLGRGPDDRWRLQALKFVDAIRAAGATCAPITAVDPLF